MDPPILFFFLVSPVKFIDGISDVTDDVNTISTWSTNSLMMWNKKKINQKNYIIVKLSPKKKNQKEKPRKEISIIQRFKMQIPKWTTKGDANSGKINQLLGSITVFAIAERILFASSVKTMAPSPSIRLELLNSSDF